MRSEANDATPSDGEARFPEPRVLTDPRAMRALAHPVRMALLEELVIAGELTATQAAALVGESPANCSFHLRQLAKYGFVEESGGGHGRNRPWRLTNPSLELRSDVVADEPAAVLAMSALGAMFQARAMERLRQWRRTETSYPRRWRRAAQSKQSIWWLTPEELEEIGEELLALMYRYSERFSDPAQRPPGAAPVEFLAFAYPLQMPAAVPPPVAGGGQTAGTDAEGDG